MRRWRCDSPVPWNYRYETTLKRDLYRAIQMLQAVQDRRKAGTIPRAENACEGCGRMCPKAILRTKPLSLLLSVDAQARVGAEGAACTGGLIRDVLNESI